MTPTTIPSAAPTSTRIALAAVTAWLLPSLILANVIMVGDAFTASGPDADMISAAVTAWIAGPFMGLVMGWPFLLAAFCAWALLHRWNLVSPKAAVGTGLLCGVAAGLWLAAKPTFGDETGLLFLGPVVGAITGLAVWKIAYGRPATSADPRHP